MKLTPARRLWWALMHGDPRTWPIWEPLAWLIPFAALLSWPVVWWLEMC